MASSSISILGSFNRALAMAILKKRSKLETEDIDLLLFNMLSTSPLLKAYRIPGSKEL